MAWTDDTEVYIISHNEKRKISMVNRMEHFGISHTLLPGVGPTDERYVSLDEKHKSSALIMLAHLDAIKYFLDNSDKNYAIICEDDLKIKKSFSEDINDIHTDFVRMGLDIMLLGYLSMCNPRGTPNFEYVNKYTYHEVFHELWGTQMYLLSRKYATWIINTYTIEWTLTNGPFAADWTITKNGNRCLAWPMLAIEDADSDGNGYKHSIQNVYVYSNFNRDDYI